MALNPDKVGTIYPPYTYEVSREKIREYATALGETDPRYLSDGDDCVAPPTFAACFTIVQGGRAWGADPELGAHEALVHGSQRFVFGDRPLRPGDRLTCTPSITGISARGSNEFLVTEVDARFSDTGESAVLAEATIVFLGSAPAADASGGVDRGAADADTAETSGDAREATA